MLRKYLIILISLMATIVQNVDSSLSDPSNINTVLGSTEPENIPLHLQNGFTHKVRRDIESIDSNPGIFYEQIYSPVFYDSFVPVIHSFEIPNWNTSMTKLASLTKLLEYKASYCNPSYTSIPTALKEDILQVMMCKNVTRAAQEVHNRISFLLKTLEPFSLFPEDLKLKTNSDEEQSITFSCADINPHFKDSLVSPEEFEKYLKNLNFCSPVKIAITKSFKSKERISSIISNFFLSLLNGNSSSNNSTIELMESKQSSMFRNFISSYETSLITEMHLWNSAISTCQSNFVPPTLVTKDILKGSLAKLARQITEKDVDVNLSIPFDKLNIQRYYKHKLADCILLTNGTFTVRILVPVVKIRANYVLRRYYTIPFLQTSNQGSQNMSIDKDNENKSNKLTKNGKSYTTCKLTNLGGYFVEDLNASNRLLSLTKSPCRANDLCRVPDMSERSSLPSCLLNILQNNQHDFDLIRKTCVLKCDTIDSEFLPLVQRKESDRFVVLGDSLMNITIQCPSSSDSMEKQVVQLKDNTSLFISLPCMCSILHNPSQEMIQAQFPCQNDVSKLKLDFLTSIKLFQDSTSSSLLIPEEKGEADFGFAKGEESATMSPLTRNILYSKYTNLDRKFKELSQSFLILNRTVSQMKLLDKNNDEFRDSSGHNSSYHFYDVVPDLSKDHVSVFNMMCWIIMGVTVVMLVTLATLGYFVYRLYRWKQVEPFKPDRTPVFIPTLK